MKPTKSTFFLGALVGGLGAALVPLLLTQLQADTKLLPFQGRLTDTAGGAVPDGPKVVEFKMYDAPTGGAVKWAGEVHKLSVNGGLVNTMLGSKASLGSVDFGSPTFLQITIDAQSEGQTGHGVIDAADPPLLPRQSVVSAVYAVEAGNARGLQWTDAGGMAQGTANWSALFGPGRDPATATVDGARVTPNTLPVNRLVLGSGLTSAHLADNSVTVSELANNSVDSAAIIDREVKSVDIGIGEVSTTNLGDGAITSEKINDGTIQSRDVMPMSLSPDRLLRDIAIFSDTRAMNMGGGTGTEGWQRRELNREEKRLLGGNSGISLAAHTITLQPGTYYVRSLVPGWGVHRFQAVLRDVTGSSAEFNVSLRGTSANSYFTAAGNHAMNHSWIEGIVDIAGAARSFEIWQYNAALQPAVGLGMGVDVGPLPRPEENVFTRVVIERLK